MPPCQKPSYTRAIARLHPRCTIAQYPKSLACLALNTQELANSVWALAVLGAKLDTPFIRQLFRSSFQQLGYFNAQVGCGVD